MLGYFSGKSRVAIAGWAVMLASAMAVQGATAHAGDIGQPATGMAGTTSVNSGAYHDTTPRIAIISAFSAELALLRDALHDAREYRINGVAFTTGKLQGRDVLLFVSGISMVNAAMNTQLAIDRFHITHVLFSGIAGGINEDLNIGDVNVPERWGQHLEVLMAREHSPGQYMLPPDKETLELPNFGQLHHRVVRVAVEGEHEPQPQFWFDADPELLRIARGIEGVALDACDQRKVCLRKQPRLVVGGSGLSGTAFVDNASYRKHLAQVFQANVVDMESAASAMVAQANRVPFLAFRSVSDLAGGGPDANEMHVFMDIAAHNAARVLLAFLAAWKPSAPEGSTSAAPQSAGQTAR